jgi:hypothetical protein
MDEMNKIKYTHTHTQRKCTVFFFVNFFFLYNTEKKPIALVRKIFKTRNDGYYIVEHFCIVWTVK